MFWIHWNYCLDSLVFSGGAGNQTQVHITLVNTIYTAFAIFNLLLPLNKAKCGRSYYVSFNSAVTNARI